jgi:HNH endonuclease
MTQQQGNRAMPASHDITPPENTKDIPDFPGYRASQDGKIWSCWVVRGPGHGTANGPWHELVPSRQIKKNRPGRYVRVCVLVKHRGKKRTIPVATLVLFTFIGPRPEGLEARHLDGDSQNNVLSNLAWGTSKQNGEDKVRHGTQWRPVGSKCKTAILSDEDIPVIRKLAADGIPQYKIAKQYNVNRVTITHVVTRRSWRHIP